ncbi:cupredoxin family protein [Lacisediminimonas sp.]|uniref:cupredoxin domain-containing protein n=1 Tax=Lacisediminimonas sp. TaxID=3060582 RepID=UPI002723D7EC|nr:cupredoxin family protein [Lacisediminimonas sp.]MDO8299984.1 cupredoxin family protein [Lacisediminimonas sp.]
MKRQFAAIPMAGLALLLAAGAALAHGDGAAAKHPAARVIDKEQHSFGREGDPKAVVRTIRVDMGDNMRYSPASLEIRQGDTVKFVVTNKGKIMHEMVLGTMAQLKAHGELMKKHPGMEHEDPYMAHVAPGKTEQMVWQFNQAGTFHFGCLLPGHFESGMVGTIIVKGRQS